MNSPIETAEFDVKYEAGHSYRETWEKTEYFCPACGRNEVWHETSGEDYYVGETYICVGCTAHFYLPGGAGERPNDFQDKQRVEAIRAALSKHG